MTAPALATAAGGTDPITSVVHRAAYRPKTRLAAVCMWPLWPLLDDHTGRPSGPKCMAWAIYLASLTGHPVAAAVAALLLATMFGYSMFKAALAKAALNLSSNDSVKVEASYAEQVTKTVAQLIDARLGRGPTGEALRSNPAVPDARTPSGDD